MQQDGNLAAPLSSLPTDNGYDALTFWAGGPPGGGSPPGRLEAGAPSSPRTDRSQGLGGLATGAPTLPPESGTGRGKG